MCPPKFWFQSPSNIHQIVLLNCCDPQTSRKLIRNLSNISTYWFTPLSVHNQYVSLWFHHNSNKKFAYHHCNLQKYQTSFLHFTYKIFFANIFHFQETSNESSPSVYRQIKMGLAGHGGFKRFKWFHQEISDTMVTACGEQWLSISRCARLCECEVWWRDMCRRKNARLWFSCIHQKMHFSVVDVFSTSQIWSTNNRNRDQTKVFLE